MYPFLLPKNNRVEVCKLAFQVELYVLKQVFESEI